MPGDPSAVASWRSSGVGQGSNRSEYQTRQNHALCLMDAINGHRSSLIGDEVLESYLLVFLYSYDASLAGY